MYIPEVSANGSILNSTYDLPSDRRIITIPESPGRKKTLITPPCKMVYPEYGINLIFDDNAILFSGYPSCDIDSNMINMFVMIVSYKTFLNYMIWSARQIEPDEILEIPNVETVRLTMEKIIEKQRKEDGRIYVWHESEPHEMVIDKKAISEYLEAKNNALFYAMYYYLKGTYTQEYFLVEFYKCLEVIKRELSGEKMMKKKLGIHGFNISDYKKLNRYANDTLNPISIGRHPPDIRATVDHIDTKWLFDDPKGKEVFDLGQKACRTAIEAYKNHLLTEKIKG